ncbi:hypothetical protein E2C01_024172 [Portunus trituberculatus]|uniref:Uncharacterized protein n=1 Tax=Portunus trituberculatus TaxID=210409 RepID=A0A5B7E9M6_PORTR|nr:hypothetical protein [Portunus trituberculatus]
MGCRRAGREEKLRGSSVMGGSGGPAPHCFTRPGGVAGGVMVPHPVLAMNKGHLRTRVYGLDQIASWPEAGLCQD